jgi:hypothetical protein
MDTRISESHSSLITTLTILEMEPTTCDGFCVAGDEDDSSIQDHVAHSETASPAHPVSSTFSDAEDSETEDEGDAPVDGSTTVAEQVEMLIGRSNTAEVCHDINNNQNQNSVPNESNVALSPIDCATLEVLKLCHDAGVSLEFYDKLFAKLRKHSTKNKVDVTKLPKRDTFLKSLRARISSPPPIISHVGNLQVPHFDFLAQIRDLLGSFVFNDLNNLCVNLAPEERYRAFVATDDDQYVEMCAQEWYQQTYQKFIKDPEKQFLLPLIFYIDETGTDVFQRYPLEPLMFTLGIFRNFLREKSSAWRHAGFIPKVSKTRSSLESLQLYHDCMAMVLSTLKPLQDKPPTEWLQFGDEPPVQKELIIQVCFIMGDQKSQDNLVGRKLNNSGWAGRSHRGCMCSGTSSSDPCLRCQPVPIETVRELQDISFSSKSGSPTMEAIVAKFPLPPSGKRTKDAATGFKIAQDFVKRRAGAAHDILGEVFTMHPLKNAWYPVGFGSNKNGIFGATLDDPMHFNESGLFDSVTKAFYSCFTPEELKKFEESTRSFNRHSRSSVRSGFPKARVTPGFSNCTLKTANETVGSLLSVVLTVQDDKVFDMMEKVGKRQQERYLTFPVTVSPTPSTDSSQNNHKKRKMNNPATKVNSKLVANDICLLELFPLRRNYTFGRDRNGDSNKQDFPRTKKSCRVLFKHLKKHSLGFVLDLELDEVQMEYLLVVLWKAFGDLDYSEQFYPRGCLHNLTVPVSQISRTPTKRKMESYYRQHLHGTETLRKSKRGETIELSREEMEKQTHQDENDDTKKPATNQSGPVTTTLTFPCLVKSRVVRKHGRIKPYTKGNGSTSAVLCEVKTYVEFIELALCLHAYLHYSKNLPLETRCQPEVFDRGIRKFLGLYNEYVYRGDDTIDSDTCKIHCHLHILQNILMFGDPMQYDAAKGERGLKDWAKHMSKTAQKCGIDTFLFQTMNRVSTYQLMERAQQVELWRKCREQKSNQGSDETVVEESHVRMTMNRKLPHFRFNTETEVLHSVERKGKEIVATEEKTGIVDKRILSKIREDHRDLVCIDIWGEIYHTSPATDGGQLLRAHPALDRHGEMFDWVAVTFETTDPDGVVGPAKILAFYKDGEGVDRAVVHATCSTTRRETKAGNTMLIQNSRLEFNRQGFPALRTIRVNQIDGGILVFEHVNFKGPLPPNINYTEDRSKYVVSCFDNRENWAHLFYEWACSLPETEIESTIPATEAESDTDDEVESVCSDSSLEQDGDY